jgi:hypothetical protein
VTFPLPDVLPECDGHRLAHTPTSTWELRSDSDGWVVCRAGLVRYRGPAGLSAPGSLAEPRPVGPVAFLEKAPGRCHVVILFPDEEADPLRLALPRCDARWRPYWMGHDSVTIGPSALDPRLRVRLEEDAR